MRQAIIEDGCVTNIIVATPDFTFPGCVMVEAGGAQIGDLWDGASFTRPTILPTQSQIVGAVQLWLDEQAQAKGYDNILSAASYSTSTNSKFGPEGIAARDGRDAAWSYCYEQLALVESGDREPPTNIESFIAELTPVAWP